MSDNSVQGGADTIRDIQKGGAAGPKTQVFVVDRGGTGAEDLSGPALDSAGNQQVDGITLQRILYSQQQQTLLLTKLVLQMAALTGVLPEDDVLDPIPF